MTNDTPPKACLAHFVFTTMALDPHDLISISPTLKDDMLTFMAPELLVPTKYGLDKAVPTREADIYAYGLVILQVTAFFCRHLAIVFIHLQSVRS